jgi:hypothetical protein
MTMNLADVPSAPVVPVVSRPLERVEAEIVELASQLTAATARLLGLVAGREQVRVARALRSLPLVSGTTAAASSGRSGCHRSRPRSCC